MLQQTYSSTGLTSTSCGLVAAVEPDKPVDFDIASGKAIRVARRCRGLSQTDLADALGVVQSNISNWEN